MLKEYLKRAFSSRNKSKPTKPPAPALTPFQIDLILEDMRLAEGAFYQAQAKRVWRHHRG